jgi:tRNA threonylcarbamoyladenosine biosynthesis protein TsaB
MTASTAYTAFNTSCILAMDTATGPCSAAVWKNGTVAAYAQNNAPVMQSASLIPLIEGVLEQSGTSYQDVTALAATLGPGSFTGIRVALATARAICYAQSIPCMGYSTLQVLGFAARSKTAYGMAMLNAGKGEHYYQYYTNKPWQPIAGASLDRLDHALSLAPKGEITLAGNAAVQGAHYHASGVTFPRADILAILAATHPELAHNTLSPLYIRLPDAKLPTAK